MPACGEMNPSRLLAGTDAISLTFSFICEVCFPLPHLANPLGLIWRKFSLTWGNVCLCIFSIQNVYWLYHLIKGEMTNYGMPSVGLYLVIVMSSVCKTHILHLPLDFFLVYTFPAKRQMAKHHMLPFTLSYKHTETYFSNMQIYSQHTKWSFSPWRAHIMAYSRGLIRFLILIKL